MNDNKYPYTTAYKIKGSDNWCGDQAFASLDVARKRFEELKAFPNFTMIAIFPTSGWNYGLPTKKPRYLVDRRDKSQTRIHGLDGLINSLESDWF